MAPTVLESNHSIKPISIQAFRQPAVFRASILVCAWLIIATPCQSRAADRAEIDSIVQAALTAWGVPGVAVGIVQNDRVIYLKGLGVKNLGTPDPVTAETLFPIASCTKAFTTTGMAMLVDEGKMSWDDPVRKHVNFFHLSDPLADANVTLRDLVTHRTGLGGNDLLWYRSPWNRDEIIRRVGLVKLKHSFRSIFQYQSTMFTVAGCALESASGQKWEEFIRTRIFSPLGMAGATFTTPAARAALDHATPHRKNDRGQVVPIDWYVMAKPDPAGSINASATDLIRWLRLQVGQGTFEGKRLVSAKNLNETHTPQIIIRLDGATRDMNPDTIQMSYGMGWVVQDYRGHRLISHAGAIDGFRTHLAQVPDAKLGIVLLNNLNNSQMNLALSNSLLDYLLNLTPKNWNVYLAEQVKKEATVLAERFHERATKQHHGTRPSRELEAYTGTFEDPAYGTATISLENGILIWKWSTFICDLEHYHYDTFTVGNEQIGYPQLTFMLGRDGEIHSMKFLDMLEAEFLKIKPKAAP